MADSLEHIFACQVCLEDFEGNGVHVPRLLPCTHTLCEKCIKQLIQNNKLKCPECRVEHGAPNIRSFPQNKYLVTSLSRKKPPMEESKEVCGIHGKELVMFCVEPGCQTLVCTVCITRNHRKHEVVDVEEKEKEEKDQLVETIEEFYTKLRRKKASLPHVLNQLKKKTEECIVQLEIDMEKHVKEIKKRYETFKVQVKKKAKEENEKISKELSLVDNNLTLVAKTLQSQNRESFQLDDLRNQVKVVEDRIPQRQVFKYPVYEASQAAQMEIQNLCGKVTEEVARDVENACLLYRPTAEDKRLRFEVMFCAPIGLLRGVCSYLAVLDRLVAVSCSKELKTFDIQTGMERSSVTLDHSPLGMAGIVLNGQTMLAISNAGKKRIDFHDLTDLCCNQSHATGSYVPACLTASSPSTLLYESRNPVRIHSLDCSSSVPAENSEVIIDHSICDMCVVTDGNKKVVVTSHASFIRNGLYAYNMRTHRLEWSVTDKLDGMKNPFSPRGITTDGLGHLFVCGLYQSCIHVFNVRGKWLGYLNTGDLGVPYRIGWNSAMSSLVIMFDKDNELCFTVVKVENE